MTTKPWPERLYAHYIRVTPEHRLCGPAERADRRRQLKWDEDHPELARKLRKMVGRTVRLNRDRKTMHHDKIMPKRSTFVVAETLNGRLFGTAIDETIICLDPSWVDVVGTQNGGVT